MKLRADRTRGLPVVDPEDRALVISCGAALFYLRVAMRHFGYEADVEALPDPDDPDLLARVLLGADHKETEEELMLFQAIPERRSNRGPSKIGRCRDGCSLRCRPRRGKKEPGCTCLKTRTPSTP